MSKKPQLPAKSDSKKIQKRHVRRVMTKEGPKDILINPGVRKNQPVSKPRSEVSSRSSPGRDTPDLPLRWNNRSLRPKPRQVPWTDVLSVDDGTATPVGTPAKEYTQQQIFDLMYIQPTRNIDDFAEDYYVQDEIKQLNEKILEENLTVTEAEEAAKETADDLSRYVEDDLNEPAATIVYGNEVDDLDNRGYIGHYTDFQAEPYEIEIEWKGRLGGGYYDINLPEGSRWEILHEDVALSMSDDAENLATFNQLLKDELDRAGIEYATVWLRTSNIFSTNTAFLIEKGKADEFRAIKDSLAQVYRKPEDFRKATNPFLDQVTEAKNKGRTKEELTELLLKSNDQEVRKMLRRAIKTVFSEDDN